MYSSAIFDSSKVLTWEKGRKGKNRVYRGKDDSLEKEIKLKKYPI